jgi:hypothetical protein
MYRMRGKRLPYCSSQVLSSRKLEEALALRRFSPTPNQLSAVDSSGVYPKPDTAVDLHRPPHRRARTPEGGKIGTDKIFGLAGAHAGG